MISQIPFRVVVRQCALRKQMAKLEAYYLLLKAQLVIDKIMYEYEEDTMDKYTKIDISFKTSRDELNLKIINNQIDKLLDEIINCKMPN